MKRTLTLCATIGAVTLGCVLEAVAINHPPEECTTNWCEVVRGPTGSITYTNVVIWPESPMCLGSWIYAWPETDLKCSDVITVTKWAPQTTNCLPVYSTNTYCPYFTTNWWVVSSPGYSGSGEGSFVAFYPTNCGSGTITFYGTWRNTHPCTGNPIGGGTTSKSVNFMVVNVDIAETQKAICVSATTSFTLTNTCGSVTWEVSPDEPGGPHASGSSIIAGTNCGNWTVIARSTVNTNCADSATLYVVKIDSQCVSPTPTNQTRTTIGVGEQVNLSACGTPSGPVTWTTSAGSLSSTNGTSTTLTAPGNAATATVTVNYTNGSCQRVFSVIEPTGYISMTNRTDGSYGVNVAGSGMYIDLWLPPTNVSFGAVWIMEVGAVSTNATGYFANTNVWPAGNLDHGLHEANNPVHVSADNTIGQDHASSGVCPQPWSAGNFTWPIPAVWWVPTYTTNSLPWSDQDFTIDASGSVTVSKFGHTVTRNTNDVYTTFH